MPDHHYCQNATEWTPNMITGWIIVDNCADSDLKLVLKIRGEHLNWNLSELRSCFGKFKIPNSVLRTS
jgi:hypothetical protein